MSKHFIIYTIAIICIAKICDASAPVTACSDDIVLPVVELITPSGSCTESPCTVRPGTSVNMNLNFTSPSYLENIKPQVIAHALGVDTSYPLAQTDACDGITNTKCPLAQYEFVQYGFDITLPLILPPISLSLTFSILDEDNDDAQTVCFNIELQVRYT